MVGLIRAGCELYVMSELERIINNPPGKWRLGTRREKFIEFTHDDDPVRIQVERFRTEWNVDVFFEIGKKKDIGSASSKINACKLAHHWMRKNDKPEEFGTKRDFDFGQEGGAI